MRKPVYRARREFLKFLAASQYAAAMGECGTANVAEINRS